jgi:hypothetical protein
MVRITTATKARLNAFGDSYEGRSNSRHVLRLGWRKIMNTSNLGRATQDRELHEDELDAVSGGLVVNAIIVTLVGLLLPAINEPTKSTSK